MTPPPETTPGVLRQGDTAPDFTAPTTQGEIRFHDWKRISPWVVGAVK